VTEFQQYVLPQHIFSANQRLHDCVLFDVYSRLDLHIFRDPWAAQGFQHVRYGVESFGRDGLNDIHLHRLLLASQLNFARQGYNPLWATHFLQSNQDSPSSGYLREKVSTFARCTTSIRDFYSNSFYSSAVAQVVTVNRYILAVSKSQPHFYHDFDSGSTAISHASDTKSYPTARAEGGDGRRGARAAQKSRQ
jgi:hypothetical protein